MVGHVSRRPQEKTSKQALLAKANGKKQLDDLETTVDESILL